VIGQIRDAVASTHVPAAMGETLAGRWTFRRLLDSGASWAGGWWW
jgi:L-alanine-DL-glutamate epimerase-like enolase superfamily enzyme